MNAKVRGYVAEAVGVFLVVFIGGAASAAVPSSDAGWPRVDWGVLGIALAEGFALAVALPVVFRESPGCLNPAVTLTFWVCKRLEGRQTVLLISVQLLGAVLAGLAIRAIFPERALRAATPHLGILLLSGGKAVTISCQVAGAAVEALLTFFVTFSIFSCLIDRRFQRSGALPVGLARIATVLAGYTLTGAAVNPARWFGPYVWQFTTETIRAQNPHWTEDHPVYWAGPVLGALAAGLLYTGIFLPADQAKGGGSETVEARRSVAAGGVRGSPA